MMRKMNPQRSGAHAGLVLAAGCVAWLAVVPARAQVAEVPAVFEIYRADPTAAVAMNTGTVSLNAPQVRELYFASSIIGPMQGELRPGGPGLQGQSTIGNLYVPMADRLEPKARMPRMPIVLQPGPDGQYGGGDDLLVLYLSITKLPSQQACQNILDHMVRVGLLPGDPAAGVQGDDPEATGRWRILVHPPRTRGAPPAPSLYYPEAINALRPGMSGATIDEIFDEGGPLLPLATANDVLDPVYRAFWGELEFRWRDWHNWVDDIYRDSKPVNHDPVDTTTGQVPVPILMPFPRYLDNLAAGIDRTVQAELDDFTGGKTLPDGSPYHGMFFNPRAMWENVMPDADQELDRVDLNQGSQGAVRGELQDGLPEVRAYQEGADDAPIELLVDPLNGVNYLDNDRAPEGWWLPGVHTSGLQPWDNYNAPGAGTIPPTIGTNNLFYDFRPDGLIIPVPIYSQADLTGLGGPDYTPDHLVNGIGMIEMQFEYTTCIPGRAGLDEEWSSSDYVNGEDPFGPDGIFGTPDDPAEITGDHDPHGADGDEDNGQYPDDQPLHAALYPEHWSFVRDARGPDNVAGTADDEPLLADPLTEDNTTPWRVVRYSGWPFNPEVAGLPAATPTDYRAGPIVGRFVVSGIHVQPEDALQASVSQPDLGQLAYYDPGGATPYHYPQLPIDPAGLGGGGISPLLSRAVFLLGYRGNLANPGDPGPGQDYFYPVNPGTSSANHRFFIHALLDQGPGGAVDKYTNPGFADIDPTTDWAVLEHANDVGYRLRDVLSLVAPGRYNPSFGGPRDVKRFLAPNLADTDLPTDDAVAQFYRYSYNFDVGLNDPTVANAGGVDRRRDSGATDTMVGDVVWNVEPAFDGLTLPGDPSVTVRPGESVSRLFDSLVELDRVELFVAGGTSPTDFRVQYLFENGWQAGFGPVPPNPPQYDGPTYANYPDVSDVPLWLPHRPGSPVDISMAPVPEPVPTTNMGFVVGAPDRVAGVRVVNTSGGDLEIVELRVVTRANLQHEVTRSPEAPRVPQEPGIIPQPLPDSAVQVTSIVDREFTADPNGIVAAEVKVDVPEHQPPSNDAAERQLLLDTNQSPGNYATWVQPSPDLPGAPKAWDRYRGGVGVYLDDNRTALTTLTADPASLFSYHNLSPREWDVNLYRLASRNYFFGGPIALPPIHQFVRWYEEDSGWVTAGGPPTGPHHARLESSEAALQRVAVEPYDTFDIEFSVAYQRALAFREKLLDFGKVVHGGISQWTPITLVNDGNVPLRGIKLFVELPLTTVDLEDAASPTSALTSGARLIQSLPVPSYFVDQLAVTAAPGALQPSGLIPILPAPPVGAGAGATLSDLYVRIGRLPYEGRVPIGQPVGNYTGRLRAFIDDRALPGADAPGDGNDQPDGLAETGIGGLATTKLTVVESPFARIADFWDNEQDRRLASSDPLNAQPYNPVTGQGTNQPVPVFSPLFSHPDTADATPAIHVTQDPNEVYAGNPPVPNSDRLWMAWSALVDQGAGVENWSVFMQRADRTAPAGSNVPRTGYQSFAWDPNTALLSTPNQPRERNLYPSIAEEAGTNGQQHLVIWHNERAEPGGHVGALQFRRFSGTNSSSTVQILDNANRIGTPTDPTYVSKAVPRAVVDNTTGNPVLWAVWQDTASNAYQLGFNAIGMPAAYNGGPNQYVDAIRGTTAFTNYHLRTPPGLTNVADPAVLANRRGTLSNDPAPNGAMTALDVLYSAYSPLYQNQDIYWSRYLPFEDPAAPVLSESPMAEDAYRFNGPQTMPGGQQFYSVATLPGGRVPFGREINEVLDSNPETTVFAGRHVDWMMPPSRPRTSFVRGGARVIEEVNHRGFADLDQPLVDSIRAAAVAAGGFNPASDPLVILRVSQGPAPAADPNDPAQAAVVEFDWERAFWDQAVEEWVLPITAPGLLVGRGVNVARVHPGLGRVSFNKALYRRGVENPIWVYATYRPCAWRMTSDKATDSQPTAAYDAWQRLALVWRRTSEDGQGELWYRTFSLAVPLYKAPATTIQAVVTDADVLDDSMLNGSLDQNLNAGGAPAGTINRWSFVGPSDVQVGESSFSAVNIAPPTAEFAYTTHGVANTFASSAAAAERAASLIHFSYLDAGKRVRVVYEYTFRDASGNPQTGITEEAHIVPGLGPERPLPLDGHGSQGQPTLSTERFMADYGWGRIQATRFWLAYASTRDLFTYDDLTDPTQPPRRGRAGTNVYYGAFLPDFSPATLAR